MIVLTCGEHGLCPPGMTVKVTSIGIKCISRTQLKGFSCTEMCRNVVVGAVIFGVFSVDIPVVIAPCVPAPQRGLDPPAACLPQFSKDADAKAAVLAVSMCSVIKPAVVGGSSIFDKGAESEFPRLDFICARPADAEMPALLINIGTGFVAHIPPAQTCPEDKGAAFLRTAAFVGNS